MNNKSNKKEERKDSHINLSDFGIDENIINLIKPMIPQLINELLIKKTANFSLEQKNVTESINNNTREKMDILNQNVFSFRSVLLTITGFSLTIIGAILSIIVSNINIFAHQTLMIIGLLCLIFSIIISVLFILNIYHFENNKLTKQIRFNNAYLKEINQMIKNYFQTKTFDVYLADKQAYLEKKINEEEVINNEKNENGLLIGERDFTAHLVIILFLSGFVLILLSFLKF